MITLFVAGVLLIAVGVADNAARADGGSCGASCQAAGGGCGTSCGSEGGCCGGACHGGRVLRHAEFVPNVTFYAPYPYWFPQYFGPPHTDYLVVQYITPPAESALIVKERILAINAGNPALLPLSNGTPPKEPLPHPKKDELPPAP